MAYYSDATEVAAMCGKAVSDVKSYWQRDVDAFIEQYAHQSYKGNAKQYVWVGDDCSLLVLPSFADSITSISEDGVTLDVSDYNFFAPSRIVERKNTNWQLYPYTAFSRTGLWLRNSVYIVQYVEPSTTPDTWKAVANQCVALIVMFASKFALDGIALTISESGQAGGGGSGMVQSGGSTTYPASLMDEIQRTIREGIARVGT